MSVQTALQETRARIYQLVDELPPAKLTSLEDFVLFLRDQNQKQKRGPGTELVYPTRFVPTERLDALTGVVHIGGDALADSEALYDTD